MVYKVLEHTADLKIEGQGKSKEDLFASLAFGLQEIMAGKKIAKIPVRVKRNIEVSGNDLSSLLINFLNELIFLSEKYGEIYSRFKIQIKKNQKIEGEIEGAKLPIVLEVKAATFHDFVLEKKDKKWKAVVVFDI